MHHYISSAVHFRNIMYSVHLYEAIESRQLVHYNISLTNSTYVNGGLTFDVKIVT